jgi:transcriptional regulator with XRE-family HTH domain
MQNQFLSKSLEKTFLRMKTNTTARDAYVTAEVITSIAHQIRAIRVQRGWSQLELAKKLGTTQTAISRIEDPSYGRLTLKTLLDLSKVFDAGLQVKFVSLINMLHETYFVKPNTRSVPSFEDESKFVHFYSPRPKQDHQVVISNPQSNSKLNLTVNTVRIESKASTRLNFIKMSNRELVLFVQLGI